MRRIGKICTRNGERTEEVERVALRLVSLKGANMGRMFAAGGMSVLLLCGGAVLAADEPPALPPPAVEGPVTDAPGELPPAVEANPAPATATAKPAIPENRPVLVVPGVTAPGAARPRPRSLPPAAAPSTTTTTIIEEPSELPALVGPNGRAAAPATSTRVRSTAPQPARTRAPASAARSARSLSLETIPAEDMPEATIGPRPTTGTPMPGRSTSRPAAVTEQPRSVAPPRGGILGRLLPAPVSPRSYTDSRSRSAITVEPRSDPAADAALKRRIERQIGETLGTRLQSYEVRVVDRDVTIRARARFWQRRGARKSLETLPSLSGYHARIEMVD